MKYLPLIWAALWRRKPRTIFTMLSIVVAFLLYALLSAVNAAFNAGVEIAGADRLITTGRYSLTQVLPFGHLQQVRSVPGVASVAGQSWFGGYYQKESNFFPQFPTQIEPYLEMYPEIVLPEEQKQAMLNTRTGAIVAKTLADRYGFKVGDRVPIIAGIWPLADGSNNWEFDLVGIFDTKNPKERSMYEMLLFHHEYFDEARQFGKGTIGWIVIKTEDPDRNEEIVEAVDDLFANSPNETRTETERAFNQSFVKQMGDIGLIMSSIIGAVFFTLLFLTGNTMMQSVRERIPELAVLKTLGYSDVGVLALVLAESLALCVLAALVGIGLAGLLLPGIAAKLPGFSGLALKPEAFAGALGIAVLLALIVGLPPALRAMRLKIVDALAAH
ncbi:MAG: ABC transporter permease [Sinimarinibacterium flocculans]|uniref:ABC transporter permease n=1 Tax=Sinimarinibacterium flocculans TaxID=985250 RepID=UPI00248F731B|nr:FtsX-like permease family protein [Sinimarinibacterium flocculans]